MLFLFPAPFDPVSTSELGAVASLLSEFTKRNVKCIALSLDEKVETYEETYREWIKDIQKYHEIPSIGYPIISTYRDIFKLCATDPTTFNYFGELLPGRAVS